MNGAATKHTEVTASAEAAPHPANIGSTEATEHKA
jgi:hypothetical protein